MKIMSGAVVLLLLSSCSFALAAEPPYAPGNSPKFPEPVERAMIGEGSAMAIQMSGFGLLEVSQSADLTIEATFGGLLHYRAPLTLPELKEYPDVQNALKLLDEGKFVEGAAKLEAAVKKNDYLPSMYVMMYRILAAASQPKPASDMPRPVMGPISALDLRATPQAARSWLEKALIVTPKDPEPWLLFGEIALQEKRIGEAELDFAKAKELLASYPNPHRKEVIEPAVLSGMAGIKEYHQQFAEAEALLEEYLRNTPNDVVVRLRLARVAFLQSNFNESYAELEKAKEIDVSNSKWHGTPERLLLAPAIMAQFFDERQRSTAEHYRECLEAKQWFKYALKQAPDDLNLQVTVAEWALENNEMEMAKEQAKVALRIETEDMNREVKNQKYHHSIVGRMLSGKIALWQRNWTEAERYFVDVLVERPNNFEALNGLALAVVEQDDQKSNGWATENVVFDYLRDHPNDPAALTTAAWVRFRRGELPLAAEAIKKAIKAAGLDSKLVDAEHCDPNEAASLFVSGIGKRSSYASLPLRVKLRNLEIQCVMAHVSEAQGTKQQAKAILKAILDDGQPFLMKPQAQALYEKVKDAKEPKAD